MKTTTILLLGLIFLMVLTGCSQESIDTENVVGDDSVNEGAVVEEATSDLVEENSDEYIEIGEMI